MRTTPRRTSALLLLLCALAPHPFAQVRRTAPMREAPDPERDIRRREAAAEERKRDPADVMAEVNEDFERLRALRDELGAEASPSSVAAAAAEVRKRAERLEKNLAGLPPMPKDEKPPKFQPPADDARLGAYVKQLAGLLTGFLTNPVFSDAGTLDPQLAVKARRDLEGVMALSEALRKGAEKLSKRR